MVISGCPGVEDYCDPSGSKVAVVILQRSRTFDPRDEAIPVRRTTSLICALTLIVGGAFFVFRLAAHHASFGMMAVAGMLALGQLYQR